MTPGIINLSDLMAKVGAVDVNDLLRYLGGKTTQGQVMAETEKTLNALTLGKAPKAVGRLAGSGLGRGFARLVPGIGLITNVADAADVIAGDESFGNKAMDTAAMGVGGTIGAFLGGPLGASVGVSAGKSLSDATQYIFGDKKTPEQRKMELALAQLQGGGIY